MASLPTGAKDLLSSERGVFSIALVIAATMLVALGKLDAPAWLDFMKYLSAALIASKTITTAVEVHATKQPQIPTATVVKDGESR